MTRRKKTIDSFHPSRPNDDPFFSCLKEELKTLLTEAIDVLDERERQVVSLYYFEELTMKEVGAVLDIGESRVSQIHSLALVRLREKLEQRLHLGHSGASTISAA